MPPLTSQEPGNVDDKPCRAHGEIMESIGYIRGRIDEIADRSSRMESRLDYAVVRPASAGHPSVISVSSGHSSAPLPKEDKNDSSGSGGRTLLGAIVALLFAVAALLGTLHFTVQQGTKPAPVTIALPAHANP